MDFEVQAPLIDPTDVVVDLGDGFMMNEHVVVPIVWGHRLVTLHLRAVHRDGMPLDEPAEVIVEELKIRHQQLGVDDDLGGLPFQEMKTAAIRRSTTQRLTLVQDALPAKRRLRKMAPLELARAAQTYVSALEAGKNPTRSVAERLVATDSTAAKWVSRARAEGFLTGTDKGKKGGRLTNKAQLLLASEPEEPEPAT